MNFVGHNHESIRASLGLGAAGIGNLYRAVTEEQAQAVLEAAASAELTHWDTAPFYGHGLSELRIGRYLSQSPKPNITLSTKVGRVLDPVTPDAVTDNGFAAPLPFNPRFDYTYDGVMRSFETSLERLRVDRIKTVLFHDLGRETHGADHSHHMKIAMTSGLKALIKLKEQKAIAEIGIGANETAVLSEAQNHHDFDCFLLAGRYTLFEHHQSLSFMDACAVRGISIIVGGVYNSGLLATRPNDASHYNYLPASSDVVARATRFWDICKAHGVEAPVAALHFVTGHPAVRIALIGAQDAAHINVVSRARDTVAKEDLWADLITEGLISERAPLPLKRALQ